MKETGFTSVSLSSETVEHLREKETTQQDDDTVEEYIVDGKQRLIPSPSSDPMGKTEGLLLHH